MLESRLVASTRWDSKVAGHDCQQALHLKRAEAVFLRAQAGRRLGQSPAVKSLSTRVLSSPAVASSVRALEVLFFQQALCH